MYLFSCVFTLSQIFPVMSQVRDIHNNNIIQGRCMPLCHQLPTSRVTPIRNWARKVLYDKFNVNKIGHINSSEHLCLSQSDIFSSATLVFNNVANKSHDPTLILDIIKLHLLFFIVLTETSSGRNYTLCI